jgi:hypothetical protein
VLLSPVSSVTFFYVLKILERQQKLKPGETEQLSPLSTAAAADDSALEMGITKRRRA